MFRIKHVIPTVAVVIASVGVLAPVAQAQPDGIYHQSNAKTTVVGIFDPAPKVDSNLGARVHDTPLVIPVQPRAVVTGRTTPTSGGADWSLLVMGAVALGLIVMLAGDELLFRRRGQLAT
jgi:hypothetical protein